MNLKLNKMAIRKIKPGEEFDLNGVIYVYNVENNGQSIHLKRVKEAKRRKIKPAFIPPTLDDVKAYFKQKGYSEEGAIKAFNSYEASEPPWHDSRGNPVKMWKQKMLNNWFRDEFKIKNNVDSSFMDQIAI